jgi:1-phosphofructokinase
VTDTVMIFSPAPQLTVTIEQGPDGPDIHLHAGGQGFWQARLIASLGGRVVLCAALGGEVGRVLQPLIEAEGIEVRAAAGGTANGAYVHDRREGRRREIAEAPGRPLSRHETDELYSLALAEGMLASVSLLSGVPDPSVLPADTYRRLAGDLGRNGRRVAADLAGDYLTAVLDGRPALLKVAHDELVASGRAASEAPADLVTAMRGLRDEGARAVVVSRADQPALALLGDELREVRMPNLEAADPRGAGDSMTAGAVAVLARGGDLAEAVRTGAAAGALNVTRHGLGTANLDAVRKMIANVELRPLAEEDAR